MNTAEMCRLSFYESPALLLASAVSLFMCVALFVRIYQYLYNVCIYICYYCVSAYSLVQFYMLDYKIRMYSILVAYRNEAFHSGWINEVKVAIYIFG